MSTQRVDLACGKRYVEVSFVCHRKIDDGVTVGNSYAVTMNTIGESTEPPTVLAMLDSEHNAFVVAHHFAKCYSIALDEGLTYGGGLFSPPSKDWCLLTSAAVDPDVTPDEFRIFIHSARAYANLK